MTVRQLLAATSSAELTEWHAYFLIRNNKQPEDADEKLDKLFGKQSQ